VSKFLLNLLVKILKVLPNYEFYLNSKISTLFIFLPFISPASPFSLLAHPASPASLFLLHCASPLLPGLPPPFAQPINLWRIPQNTLSSLIRAFHPRRLLSLTSLTYGSCLSALSPHPVPADPGCATAKSHRAKSPRATQLCTSSGHLRALTRPLIKQPQSLPVSPLDSSNWRLQAEALTPIITRLHCPGAPPPVL
jgi:hypothetical protein